MAWAWTACLPDLGLGFGFWLGLGSALGLAAPPLLGLLGFVGVLPCSPPLP